MEKEYVQTGMKVVPFQKTASGWEYSLECSEAWKTAKNDNQPYLYVTGFNGKYFMLDSKFGCHGDYFNAEDFELYIE